MNFQVPQFIEIEDKVIGPLTFRQFIYLVGGAGLSFLCYAWFGLYISIVPITLIGGFSLALAFYKINDRPFIFYAESYFKYLLSTKLYLWKKRVVSQNQVTIEKSPVSASARTKTLSQNKLHDLSWSLNIQKMPSDEDQKI